MDIVAESLSTKVLKSREVLVNGKDIMDYIRSKLSTAVEFNGVYNSLEEANTAGANFNGSIVIVGSIEYIWYDKDNKWHEIGDETAVRKLAVQISELSSNISAFGIKDTIYSIDKSHAYPTTGIENTPNFKIYTSAFTDGEIYGFNIQRSNNKQYNQISVGTQLSIVGSSASSASQITPQNTYVVSKGTVAYPDFGEAFYVDMQHTANSIPSSVNMLYFYFFDGNTSKNARFDTYSFDAQYAPTFMAPSYYDISAYTVSSNVPSKAYVQQKFNDTINYTNSVSGNVDELSSTVSNLSTDVDSISSNVDDLSTYLAYASLTSESTTEGMDGGFDRAGIRRIVFMPSYLGMGTHDELTSIVLKTKDKALEPILTGDNEYGYIRVRKYISTDINSDGQLIGQSNKFHWPNTVTANVEIPFSEKIKFEEPNAQYYFEFLSGTATTVNETQLTAFGVSLYLVNSSAAQLPTLSSHYYAMNWNWQANPQTNAIQPRWRPYLSANYRHTYSMAEVEGKVEQKFNQIIGEASDLSSASTINGAKKYANDLVSSLNVEDSQESGQFVVAVSQENGVISVQKAALTIPEGLSSYVDTKRQLSNDGYATSSSIPSYSDISTNIHLSNYALANSVSSTTELNAKFNTLSTYSQTKQQLSSDGYAQTTDIPTYSDISSNIHLSDYALTSQLSSAADISVAIKLQEQLDTKNKVEIAHDLSGAFTQTDLSIIKVTDGNLQTYAESLSTDTINPNAIYMLQLSAINAFGQQIHNVADGTISSDAATCGQLQKLYQMIVELSGKIS